MKVILSVLCLELFVNAFTFLFFFFLFFFLLKKTKHYPKKKKLLSKEARNLLSQISTTLSTLYD
jgi:predicted PurR-regulated permease PerM